MVKLVIFAHDTPSWYDEQPWQVSLQFDHWQQSYYIVSKEFGMISKGFWKKKKKMPVTLNFDPKLPFLHSTHHFDMGNNHAMFHPNVTINSKVMGCKRFCNKKVNCDLNPRSWLVYMHTSLVWWTTILNFLQFDCWQQSYNPEGNFVMDARTDGQITRWVCYCRPHEVLRRDENNIKGCICKG